MQADSPDRICNRGRSCRELRSLPRESRSGTANTVLVGGSEARDADNAIRQILRDRPRGGSKTPYPRIPRMDTNSSEGPSRHPKAV